MNDKQYRRLQELNAKISNGLANSDEKNEYVRILKDNGKITNDQYKQYKENNSDDFLKFILIVGGFALLAYLISRDTNS